MLINFQNIHNDYYLKDSYKGPQHKSLPFSAKSVVSSQVKQAAINPDLLKVYFAGFKTHYDIKDSYLLDSKPVSIPAAVVKNCRFYSRPVGMVKVKNKSTNEIENAYVILGVNSGWNEIKILNAKGDTLGSSRFGEITTKVPDPKDNSLKEMTTIKCYTMGNDTKYTFFYEGDVYGGIGIALHKALTALIFKWGYDGNYILSPMDKKSDDFHRFFGFDNLPGSESTLYIPETRKRELEAEFKKSPILFYDAETNFDKNVPD